MRNEAKRFAALGFAELVEDDATVEVVRKDEDDDADDDDRNDCNRLTAGAGVNERNK